MVILRVEQATASGWNSQDGKETAAYPKPVHIVGARSFTQTKCIRTPGESAGKDLLAVSKCLPKGIGHLRIIAGVDAHAVSVCNAHFRQFLWIGHRQAAQTNGVEQLKNCRVGADPQRKRRDGNDRKYRTEP